MIILLSPAKTLDYNPTEIKASKTPVFKKETSELISILKKKSPADIGKLMHIKEKLSLLNYERYQNFSDSYTKKNSKAAILAFNGDVYVGLEAHTFSNKELERAQDSIRILSGLYGVLRPMDKMQPYRLEMGTHLKNPKGSNLYKFWGDQVSLQINKDLKKSGSNYILNLASKEYFSVLDKKILKGDLIEIAFKEYRDGKLKFISFSAKKARGMMARYVVKNKIKNIEGLKGFNYENYSFEESLSTENNLMFVR